MAKSDDLTKSFPCTMAMAVDDLTIMADGEGGALSEEDRRRMLKAVRQGEVVELTIDATVFRQSKTPRPLPFEKRSEANHKHAYFAPEELAAFARSFRGKLFLRDHNRGDLSYVGGEILSSELDTSDPQWAVIRQRLRAVKPWAVEAALDGTLRTFSIGWDPKQRGFRGFRASALCSVCGDSMFSEKCSHYPGDDVKFDGGKTRVIVEMQWRGVIGAETSGVAFAAVAETSVDEVRAALSEFRGTQDITKDAGMTAQQLKAIGLPADATEEQIDARLSALSAGETTAKTLATEKAAAETERDIAQAELAKTIQAQRAAKAAADKAELDAARESALADGRMVPGDNRDSLFKQLAEIPTVGHARALQFLESLAPGEAAPVGAPLQSRAASRTPSLADNDIAQIVADHPASYGLTEQTAQAVPAIFKQLGLSAEDIRKYGDHVVFTEED